MQIIERSLPKKQIIKKEPSLIVKEEAEKSNKLWQSLATKSIPRHHRNFYALLKKRQIDAKRFSDSCQREVNLYIFLSCIIHFSFAFLVMLNEQLHCSFTEFMFEICR
jgi:Trk-type K+ transport system membrane component